MARSEALAVDDGGARLVVLALGDPHLLEGTQGRQDGAANPHGVLALWWGHNLDLHGGWSQGSELLGHALADAWEHGGAARQDHVGIQILADVHVALHDGLEGGVVDAAGLLSNEAGLKEHLWATEALATNGDDVAIRQLIGLLLVGALSRGLHLSIEVRRDVAQLLLHVAHDFSLRGGGEGVASLGEDLHEVLCQVTASQVKTQDGMGQCIALVDWHGVRHTIAAIHHNAGGASTGIQRKHSLDGHIHGRHVEGLEHDLGHALSVGLWVQGRLSQQHWVLLWRDSQLIVERVVPNLLHVVPVGHNAVLDWVLQRQHTALALRLITHVAVLLVHANHDARHLRPADDGRENSTRGIISRKACLAHAGTVVHHQCGNLLLCHDC
mmetsp:Transcript_36969/g.86650  ORF Transcript_36969/g.86650 Transcript_36969/m.86650 type:complete len:383 (-) Transcript_36969:71-1219(-)